MTVDVYAFIVPATLLLMIAEIIYSLINKDAKLYSFQDTISNIGTGIGNQCVNIGIVFFIVQMFYPWLHKFSPWDIPNTWYTVIILLILSDFLFYWFHRAGHKINVFWAAHMPHHSSEEFNLSVGVRASFTQRIFQFLFFDWLLVLIGFSPDMVYMVAGIHLFIAYWHHTKIIKSMGWYEKIFVAPSHHRVHHGVNPQYLDKNFSEFLILWDRWFGTHEDEVEEVCYGITHPPRTWDPIFINIQYWKQLIDDAVAAPKFIDKIKIWFMPLGWRPRGLPPFPQDEVLGYTKEQQTKFTSKQFKGLTPYLVMQIIAAIGFMYLVIGLKLGDGIGITWTHRAILSVGLFGMIIAWGGLTEGKRWSVGVEVSRLLFMGGTLIYVLNDINLISLTGWGVIGTCLFVGVSILYVTYRFKESQLEGRAFQLEKA